MSQKQCNQFLAVVKLGTLRLGISFNVRLRIRNSVLFQFFIICMIDETFVSLLPKVLISDKCTEISCLQNFVVNLR